MPHAEQNFASAAMAAPHLPQEITYISPHRYRRAQQRTPLSIQWQERAGNFTHGLYTESPDSSTIGRMDGAAETDPRVEFGRRLRELRRERGLTQMALAEASGLHLTYVNECERGHRNIALLNIHKLAKALGVGPDELLK